MKMLLFLVGLVSVALADTDHIELSPEETEIARAALHNPDLYDGDMVGIEGPFDAERNVRVGSEFRWPGARVPYIIEESLDHAINLINQAMDDYHRNTCVRFVPRTHEQNYIRMYSGQGCFSAIGKVPYPVEQSLSLGKGCEHLGTIVHELGHALGFYHEQSRSDRDQYLILYFQNVKQGMRAQFFKLEPDKNILYNEFDYNSIMIYGSKSFSMNGQDTMVARNGQRLSDPFNKRGMTSSDIERVRKMYNC